MKLSIIIPVFNEEKTVEEIIKRVEKVSIKGVNLEIIVVDDGSTDKSKSKIQNLKTPRVKKIFHKKNIGKGGAVRTGIDKATGDFIIIQDADLEYDPQQIKRLFSNIKGKKDIVYGTRLNRLPNFKEEESRLRFVIHYFGNRFLSFVTSVLYGQWITDMETCYKLFPRSAVKSMTLKSKRFDFEPEITAKFLKKGFRIKEVPIKTTPRGYKEGKKLNTISDGIIAFWTIIKYRFID